MRVIHSIAIGALLSVALATLMASGAAAQAITRSHPVGMKFDGELVSTRVFVRFTATPIDQDFTSWSRQASLDAPARAFARLVRAATAGDVVAGRPALDLRQSGRAPTETVLRAIGGMAGGWQDARIVARFVVDGSHVFVFQSQRPDGPAVGGMAFDLVNGVWKGRVMTSREPARSLVVDAFSNLASSPSEFAPLPQTRTAYAIPLSQDGSVTLEFDGQEVDFAPMDSKAAQTSDATALYRQAVLALARDDWSAFAGLHTAASKAKIEGWLQNEGRDPRARTTAAALIAKDTRVVFEMDLGPAGSLLLYAQGDQTAPPEQPIKQVKVARTADGLQLTSYFMSYQFDLTLMRSPRWPKRAGELKDLLARSKR